MRLISWNIEHPTESVAIEGVLRVLREAKPDIVAFQEVPRRVPQELVEGLSRLGLKNNHPFKPSRGWGLLVASKWTLEPLEGAFFKIPEDEEDFYRGRHPVKDGDPARLLSVQVNRPNGMFELHTVHVPPGTTVGWKKIDTLRSVAGRMGGQCIIPRILCGDFNEPRTELPGGGVESGSDHNRYAKRNPKRWQDAVESIFLGLTKNDMKDIFRVVHREQVCNLVSHRLRSSGAPRRYDHVFASEKLEPETARYLPQELWAEVSDHAPAEVVFRG